MTTSSVLAKLSEKIRRLQINIADLSVGTLSKGSSFTFTYGQTDLTRSTAANTVDKIAKAILDHLSNLNEVTALHNLPTL